MDEERNALLRRYRNNIESSGRAIIIFAAWAVLKFIITAAVSKDELKEMMNIAEVDDELVYVVFGIIFFLFMVISFLVFFYIGRSAIKYARGEKKGKGFMFLAFLIGVSSFFSIPSYILQKWSFENFDTIIASVLVDVTMCFIIYDMLISSRRMNRIQKEMKPEK